MATTETRKRAPRKPRVDETETHRVSKVEVETQEAELAEKREKTVHAAVGPRCVCGWEPQYDHALGLDRQRDRHLALSNRD